MTSSNPSATKSGDDRARVRIGTRLLISLSIVGLIAALIAFYFSNRHASTVSIAPREISRDASEVMFEPSAPETRRSAEGGLPRPDRIRELDANTTAPQGTTRVDKANLRATEKRGAWFELTAAAVPGRLNRLYRSGAAYLPWECVYESHKVEIIGRQPWAPLHFNNDGFTSYSVSENFNEALRRVVGISLGVTARNSTESAEPHTIRIRVSLSAKCPVGVPLDLSKSERFRLLEVLPLEDDAGHQLWRETSDFRLESPPEPNQDSLTVFSGYVPKSCDYAAHRIEELAQTPPPSANSKKRATSYYARLNVDAQDRVDSVSVELRAKTSPAPPRRSIIRGNLVVESRCKKIPPM